MIELTKTTALLAGTGAFLLGAGMTVPGGASAADWVAPAGVAGPLEVRAAASAVAADAGVAQGAARAAVLAEERESLAKVGAPGVEGVTMAASSSSGGGGGWLNLPAPKRSGDVFYSPSASARIVVHGHSGIFSSTTNIIEAPGGDSRVREVSRSSMQVKSGAKLQQVVVDGEVLSASKRTAVLKWARSRIGDKYNSNYLSNTRIASGKVGSDDNKQNCSQLVWAAFKSQGDVNFNTVEKAKLLSPAAYYADVKAVYPWEIRDSKYTSTYKTL